MKPYLRPRRSGIDTLEIYLSGLSAYLADAGISCIKGTGLSGTAPWQEAADLIRRQIDRGILVPCLLLLHKSSMFKDFQWHWFNLAGYEEFDGEFYVKAITYGTFLDVYKRQRAHHTARLKAVLLHKEAAHNQ